MRRAPEFPERNWKMKLITICLSYFNQNEILKKHIKAWKSFPAAAKERLNFSVIDDHSKIPAVEVLNDIDLSDIDLSIYRVEDDIFCNMSGVKNLSAKVCETEWMLELDMDTMASAESVEKMLKKAEGSGKGEAFRFNRRVEDSQHEKNDIVHPFVCLIRKDDFWRAGGCDEDFAGSYGYTDAGFWHKSKDLITVEECRDIYLDYLPEGNSEIVRNTKRNHKLLKSKKKSGKWSTDYIRFKWKKVL